MRLTTEILLREPLIVVDDQGRPLHLLPLVKDAVGPVMAAVDHDLNLSGAGVVRVLEHLLEHCGSRGVPRGILFITNRILAGIPCSLSATLLRINSLV